MRMKKITLVSRGNFCWNFLEKKIKNNPREGDRKKRSPPDKTFFKSISGYSPWLKNSKNVIVFQMRSMDPTERGLKGQRLIFRLYRGKEIKLLRFSWKLWHIVHLPIGIRKRIVCTTSNPGGGGQSNTSVVHMRDQRFSKHTLNAIFPLQEKTPLNENFARFCSQIYP